MIPNAIDVMTDIQLETNASYAYMLLWPKESMLLLSQSEDNMYYGIKRLCDCDKGSFKKTAIEMHTLGAKIIRTDLLGVSSYIQTLRNESHYNRFAIITHEPDRYDFHPMDKIFSYLLGKKQTTSTIPIC